MIKASSICSCENLSRDLDSREPHKYRALEMLPGDQDRNWSHDQEFERNPFVAFRRFADDQISSIFRGVFEPPNLSKLDRSLEEAQKEMWSRFGAGYERATNPERRQTESRGVDDPVHPPQVKAKETPRPAIESPKTRVTRASVMDSFLGFFGKTTAAQEQERAKNYATKQQGPKATQDQQEKTIEDLIDSSDLNRSSRLSLMGISEESGDEKYRSILVPCWALPGLEEIDRRMKSESKHRRQDPVSKTYDLDDAILAFQGSYSPLHLEHEGPMRRQVDWRAAFEDLLCAERGEPMMGEYYNGYLQPQPRGSWLMNMLLRGHINISDCWHQEMFGIEPPYEHGETPESLATKLDTELDVYDLFPNSIYNVFQKLSNASTSPTVSEEILAKPQILSTLTSTEQVRLPDGSTTTRRILKKRFADGREESEDSTESTPPAVAAGSQSLNRLVQLPTPEAQSISDDLIKKNEELDKRGTWFWSH